MWNDLFPTHSKTVSIPWLLSPAHLETVNLKDKTIKYSEYFTKQTFGSFFFQHQAHTGIVYNHTLCYHEYYVATWVVKCISLFKLSAMK